MVNRVPVYGNNPIPYRNRRWLYEMYWGHGLSMPQVAERSGCARITIVRWMDKLGVPRRDVPAAVTLTYDTIPGLRYLRSKQSKEIIWSDPEHKEFMSAVSKALWEDVEFRDKMTHRMLQLWDDPDYVKSMTGENAPNWRGGISYIPYTVTFNARFKLKILELDGYCCIVCGGHNRLAIHHIDYDKQHTLEDNCVTLCNSCHGRTNYNRDYWQSYFQEYLESCRELIQ